VTLRALPLVLAWLLLTAAAPPPPEVPVETYRLENGLTVVLSRDQRLPVVAVEVRYLVGSAHEVKGRSGFAHLFEHLMFQGSEHFDQEYFAPFEPIGGDVNGTTNTDRTNYYERVPKNYLELALWMESDRMQNLLPVLTQEKLDNQRDVVKNERRQRYENAPYGMVWIHLHDMLWPEGHPYHTTTIGSHEDLTAATLDDVKAFFAQYYVPSNAVLTIVGDFDPDETKLLVERYFGGMPAGQRAPTPTAQNPEQTKIEKRVEVDPKVKLPRIYVAWNSPAFLQPGDAALDVYASILTEGKTSRLYKPLVYEKKVAKDVAAFQMSQQLGSAFIIQVTGAPGKTVDELWAAVEETLKTTLATPPTDDEMARAINGWRKSFYGRVEGVLSRAQMLSTYLHLTGRPDYIAEDLARYTSLTPSSVQAEISKWLKPDAYVRLDIVPSAEPAAAPATPEKKK
jgi:zinc protease